MHALGGGGGGGGGVLYESRPCSNHYIQALADAHVMILCMKSRPGQRLSTLDIGSKWVETVQAIGFMMQALPLLTHRAGSHNFV